MRAEMHLQSLVFKMWAMDSPIFTTIIQRDRLNFSDNITLTLLKMGYGIFKEDIRGYIYAFAALY